MTKAELDHYAEVATKIFWLECEEVGFGNAIRHRHGGSSWRPLKEFMDKIQKRTNLHELEVLQIIRYLIATDCLVCDMKEAILFNQTDSATLRSIQDNQPHCLLSKDAVRRDREEFYPEFYGSLSRLIQQFLGGIDD